MKLVMLAYLEGDEKCVDRMLAELDITTFSRLVVEGHGPHRLRRAGTAPGLRTDPR